MPSSAPNIHIYYRHTSSHRSTGKDRPNWFSHELCFANLLESLTAQRINLGATLNIVFDGSEDELALDFSFKHISSPAFANSAVAKRTRIHRIDGGDQRAAWLRCLDIVVRDLETVVRDCDLLYFLENDYMHQSDWMLHLADLIRKGPRWDYLSLYDHPDKYTGLYNGLRSRIVIAGARHWRSTPSTCWTFLVSKKTLQRDYRYLKFVLRDRYNFPFLTKVLRRTLLSPIPSLSTHCMAEFLSPGTDWAQLAAETGTRLKCTVHASTQSPRATDAIHSDQR